MRKKVFSVILSFVILSMTMSMFTGCNDAKSFTVTFLPGAELNINDAVSAEGLTEIDDTKLYVDGEYVQTVTSVSQLKPPKFARKGYRHQGWNMLLSNITEDAIVYANWVQNSFDVVFTSDADDAVYGSQTGKDIMVTQTVKSGVELVPPIFTRLGQVSFWDYKQLIFIDGSCTITPSEWRDNTIKQSYTIELVLECVVGKTKIVCSLPTEYINQYNLVESLDRENVYLLGEFVEGSLLPELPNPEMPSDKKDYAFSSWLYNGKKVNGITIINEENFPNATNRVLTLVVSCYYIYTPFL